MRDEQKHGIRFSGKAIQKREVSDVLPPIALAAVVLATASPVLASASGDRVDTYNFPGIVNADGFFYNVKAPNPDVGPGVRVLTHNRAYVNRPAYHFVGVGYMTYDRQSNRVPAYQVSDSNGNYIYTLGFTYPAYDSSGAVANLSGGMWRVSGQTWHINWWGPNFNTGVDVVNTSGANDVTETSLGPDGWGGCPSSYPVRYAWYWIYRYKYTGSWYYFPASTNYEWGNTPTWFILGSLANGKSADFGTVSCP